MYDLDTFQFESTPIRALFDTSFNDPAEPVFVAEDIVAALGYTTPLAKTLSVHCRELPQYYSIPNETRVIRERDANRLILNSPLPDVSLFLDWFRGELLPRVSWAQDDYTPGDRLSKLCESYQNYEYEMAKTARIIARTVEHLPQLSDSY